MKSSFVVMTTSSVNLKKIVIPPSVIFDGYAQTREGYPSLISHDFHRPIGWTLPVGLVFDCNYTRLIGQMITPSTREESESINQKINFYINKQLEPKEESKDKIRNLLHALKIDEVEIQTIGQATVAIGDKILRKKYPELFEGEDDDGLISFKNLNYMGNGVFKYKDILLFASRKFRRSASIINNFNEDFLDYYCQLEGSFEKRIAIDDCTIGLPESLSTPVELDYWWGPKFDDDIMSIQDGVTRHEMISDATKLLLGIEYTDFRWYTNKEHKKVFECEEVLNIPTFGLGIDKYGFKYCHAIFCSSDLCEHVDGAIRIYSEEKASQRKDTDIVKAGKDTKYEKMWRLDGKIDREIFLQLVHYHFRSNTLVSEYFGEKNKTAILEERDARLNQVDEDATAQTEIIGDCHGILVSCGIINREFEDSYTRFIDSQMHKNGSKYVDFCVVDLLKIFKSHSEGYSEEIYEYIAFDDLIINIPPIYHCGTSAFQNANKTCECIKEYLELLVLTSAERLVSFMIACEIDQNEFIFFSYCGDISNILQMIRELNIFPPSKENISKQCNLIDGYLTKEANAHIWTHEFDYFLSNDGALYFPRKFVKDFEIDRDGEKASFKIYEKVAKDIAFASIIHEAVCSKCDEDYLGCQCVVHKQESQIIMKNIETIGLFHTDRKA